jgi:uncharacterized protein
MRDAGDEPEAGRVQVLAVDGGGYKGIFAAAVLAALEDDLEISIADNFDLITGTSTGGIIALALGLGLRAHEIVNFYREHGSSIFRRPRLRMARRLVHAKYPVAPLRDALGSVFDDHLLADSKVPLVIPSFDLCTDDVYLFRTPHDQRLRRDWKETMVDVALATCAAPTYLPAHRLRALRLVDGGIWANNPAIVGITEAVSVFGAALGDIRMLSVSTTRDVEHRPRRLDTGGMAQWATGATDVILRAQSRSANNIAGHLLPGRLLRCEPPVPDGLLRLDRTTTDELIGRAQVDSRFLTQEFERLFDGHQRRPYTPWYSPTGSRAQPTEVTSP